MVKKVAFRLLLLFGIFVAVLAINPVIDIQEGTTGSASSKEVYMEQAGSFISDVNRDYQLTVYSVHRTLPVFTCMEVPEVLFWCQI